MGLRFRKSVKICKGVRVNFGKTGASLSVGTRGCRYSMHTSGRRTASVGIPGTGIYYTQSLNGSSRTYSSAAQQDRQRIQQEKLALQQKKEDEKRNNALLVREYENYIDIIRNVHRECDVEIDWESVYNAPAPHEEGCKGRKQIEAEFTYNNFKPSFIDKMFGNGGEKKRQKLFEAISIAKAEDEQARANWMEMHEFSKKILEGDVDCYLLAVEESNPFEDLVEYGSDFEIGTDSKDCLTVEFHAKSNDVVPMIAMSLTSTGKLSKKNLSKTMYYDYVQDYVCSCSVRIARELFAILPIRNVIVHAIDSVINTSTGNEEDAVILSVDFNKQGFQDINFDRIDASDFVATFEHHMKFMKTTGFKPVKRLGE